MDFINLDKLKKYSKTAGLGFLCIFLYFFIPSIELDFLEMCHIDYDNLSLTVKVIYLIAWETVMVCSMLLVFNKKILRDMKNMKENHKQYFKKYFKFYLIAMVVMVISNLIINVVLSDGIASNEEALRDAFQISPIYIFLSSVIFAPIIEELVFRQSIRNIIPNKVAFILLSGLIFGSLHIVTGYSGPFDLLYLIPYCAPGFACAYMLADSDNIFISIAIHCMHNGILISMQFALLIFS